MPKQVVTFSVDDQPAAIQDVLRSGAWVGVHGYLHGLPRYVEAVLSAPPGATLVEVGVFKAQGLTCLGELARALNKPLRIVGYDLWSAAWVDKHGASFERARANLDFAGLQNVEIIVSESAAAAALHADGSCHWVYVDAGHTKRDVLSDCSAWWPKVKVGGCMEGDDWDMYAGVRSGLSQLYGESVRLFPGDQWTRCWSVRRESPASLESVAELPKL